MAITVEEQSRIDRRRAFIRQMVIYALSNESYLARIENGLESRGRWMHQRMLSLAKIALHSNGQHLLTSWKAIRDEVLIPWDLHYKMGNHASWKAAPMNNYFYITNTSNWTARRLFGVSGYQAVTETAAWEFLYPAGQHPNIEHPTLSTPDVSMEVTIGTEKTLQLTATNGVKPLHYEAAGTWPEWITCTASGLVTATVPYPFRQNLNVRVLDVLDDIDEAELAITATAPTT